MPFSTARKITAAIFSRNDFFPRRLEKGHAAGAARWRRSPSVHIIRVHIIRAHVICAPAIPARPHTPPAMPKRLPAFFHDLNQSTGFLLWQASHRWQRRQRRALAPVGLTHAQFFLLASVTSLAAAGGPVSQATLARHAGVDPMTTSQVLRALQSRKLVRRVPHPTDPRAKALAPTAAGRKLAREAAFLVDAADRELFDPLGADRARLEALLGALRA
jgi:DNA-binding MarR family transcriptional regulator